ncbi:hypothetical protein GCM10010493_35210 [Streptomyces lavendulae subsp. grasserius]
MATPTAGVVESGAEGGGECAEPADPVGFVLAEAVPFGADPCAGRA